MTVSCFNLFHRKKKKSFPTRDDNEKKAACFWCFFFSFFISFQFPIVAWKYSTNNAWKFVDSYISFDFNVVDTFLIKQCPVPHTSNCILQILLLLLCVFDHGLCYYIVSAFFHVSCPLTHVDRRESLIYLMEESSYNHTMCFIQLIINRISTLFMH